jgi:hypothetical protein
MALKGWGPVRRKIVIDNKIIEQEYGGNFDILWKKEVETDDKLHNHICKYQALQTICLDHRKL